jgi:DNA-binding response OmpR family regulator
VSEPAAASVLIIEDEAVSRHATIDLIESAGYRAVPARSLAEARALLQQEVPDVILLDVHLPDGSGVGFLAELKADDRTAQVPVVLVTAMDSEALPVGLERAAAILTKPPRERMLLATVAAACGRKR